MALYILSKYHNVWVFELFAFGLHPIDPLASLLKQVIMLLSRIVNLLILGWKLNRWVKRDRKVEIRGRLLILHGSNFSKTRNRHEVDLMLKHSVGGQKKWPIESEVKVAFLWICQDRLQWDFN